MPLPAGMPLSISCCRTVRPWTGAISKFVAPPKPKPSRAWARIVTSKSRVNVPVTRRGVTRWSQFELRTRYPFGWFRAWTYVQGSLTAFVAPQPRGERPLPSVTAAAGSAAPTEARGDEDFAGLRSYTPGVPLKHMAWKVLARGGDAAVRSYTDMAAQPEWLEWSALEGLEIEARLSQLCRWVLQSEAGYRRPYGLRLPGVEISPGRGSLHRARCLRALATYGVPPQ